jgi:hypothetical protein
MNEERTDRRERYVDYANCCLHLAKAATDNQARNRLREMASEWLKLAEQAIAQ